MRRSSYTFYTYATWLVTKLGIEYGTASMLG